MSALDEEKIWTAHHESGHAVATVLMFRQAKWLPAPCPSLPVKFVEITRYAYKQWVGQCFSSNIYSSEWDCYRSHRYLPLMESQLIIELAGGIAESMHRNVPLYQCGADTDRKCAETVLNDLVVLTNTSQALFTYETRTRELLKQNWCFVQRMANVLAEEEFIDGNRVNFIVRFRR